MILQKYRTGFRKTTFIPDDHPEKEAILRFFSENDIKGKILNALRKRFKRAPYWELKFIQNYLNLLNKGFKWASTLESHIAVYGETLGRALYQEWVDSCELNVENFKKWNGDEWEEKWNDFRKKSSSVSKEAFIKKYGAKEGEEKYKEYCKSQGEKSFFNWKFHVSKGMSEKEAKALVNKIAKNGTLENTIAKYGKEEGTKRYENRAKTQGRKITLAGYIDKYGEEAGWEEYRKVLNKKAKWNLPEEALTKISMSEYLERCVDYKIYCNAVIKWTKRSEKYMVKPKRTDFSSRGGVISCDHKVSKYNGFHNNIPSCIIGSVYNLEYMELRENSTKYWNNSMTITELLDLFFNKTGDKNEN